MQKKNITNTKKNDYQILQLQEVWKLDRNATIGKVSKCNMKEICKDKKKNNIQTHTEK